MRVEPSTANSLSNTRRRMTRIPSPILTADVRNRRRRLIALHLKRGSERVIRIDDDVTRSVI